MKYYLVTFETKFTINGVECPIPLSCSQAFPVDEEEETFWEAAYHFINDNSFPKNYTFKKGCTIHYDKGYKFLQDMNWCEITEEEYKNLSLLGVDDIGYDFRDIYYGYAGDCGFDANEYYDEHKN
jgi:hypothetical protein